MAERARLEAVAPDFDYGIARELGVGHLATHSRRRFLAPAFPRAERAEDVVETHRARLHPIIFHIVLAEVLGDQLFPAVGVLRLRRISVFLFQRRHFGFGLQVFRIDTRRRRVEVPLHTVDLRRLDGVRVDEDVVVQDLRVMGRDETHAAHVGSQRVDVVDAACGLEAIIPATQVQQFEFVGSRGFKLRLFDVDAAHPVTALF